MANKIRSAIARWVAETQCDPRAVLVLRVENIDLLRASLGPVLLDRMIDAMAQRLGADLRFLPQHRHSGQPELCGPLADRRPGALPGHLARLGAICRSPVDLGEVQVMPVVNAVIVNDETGRADLAALYDHGRQALAACSPLAQAGQIRFVAHDPDQPVTPAEPIFAPDQIRVAFQPQSCCDTGELVALRVLAHVEHPDHGLLDMADFQMRLSPEARASATNAVLRLALSALRGWDRMGRAVPFVSIAPGDRELADPAFAEAVLWELDRLELSPDRLEIEVAEPIGRGGGRLPVAATLQRLTAAGCLLAMGDFGTGSAGLDDLRRFGMGRVRIGRGFVAGCDRRADQQRMILAVLALAEHLRVKTVADGAVTADERTFLAQIGFDAVQGRAVSAPLAAAELDEFLDRQERERPQLLNLPRRA